MTNNRLCFAMEGIGEKVEVAEIKIRELRIQLNESQEACTAMTEIVHIIHDLQDEMGTLRAQLLVLQRAVGNGQAAA